MSVIDYLKMLFGWLPTWFIVAFLAFVAVLAILLVIKIVAFLLDAIPLL